MSTDTGPHCVPVRPSRRPLTDEEFRAQLAAALVAFLVRAIERGALEPVRRAEPGP